ncbi:hypothetical protein YC2023_081767 [Brassica napus]
MRMASSFDLSAWFRYLQWVELLCCVDVLSLVLKPTDFLDYLVRGFGAVAQLRVVLE